MSWRTTTSPVTHIEGYLRIDCKIENGIVSEVWAPGTMRRDMEETVKDCDPRDAWVIVQRICGVYATAHTLFSVRATESTLSIDVPINAQYIRNIILAAHTTHDHIVHFYQLSAPDWVDTTSVLQADPTKASEILKGVSAWHLNSPERFTKVQNKIKDLAASGQLGIFANGYWGHSAMKLPPGVDLIAAAHYLQALEYQRDANRVVALLDGKTPHTQNLAVSGAANPINPGGLGVLNLERLVYIKPFINRLSDFVEQVYKVGTAVIAALYPEWLTRGRGAANYPSVPEFPIDSKSGGLLFPGDHIENADLPSYRPITSHSDGYLTRDIQESAKYFWHEDGAPQAPWEDTTIPAYDGRSDGGEYSQVKSPTFYGEMVKVGPLANMLVKLVAGRKSIQNKLNEIVTIYQRLTGNTLEVAQLYSTLGRTIDCTVHYCELQDILQNQYNALITNIGKGDRATFVKPNAPATGEPRDVGLLKVPYGMLSHRMVIKDGIISNYQAVVPSTWNSGPRNFNDDIDPYKQSLVGTPVADPNEPLEMVRTIYSPDPRMAYAVYVVDTDDNEVVSMRALWCVLQS